mmetsp:Transcript_30648/g.46417  ORF Transcript_30648/g.46417 Transcript_30648/m.46417 type:complete len:89 (-) Transcript_30648:33-299(-)
MEYAMLFRIMPSFTKFRKKIILDSERCRWLRMVEILRRPAVFLIIKDMFSIQQLDEFWRIVFMFLIARIIDCGVLLKYDMCNFQEGSP